MADRGKYIAACLTICRAYIAAGRPGKLNRLASFGGWSDTVRSALVWLGEADPVKSMDTVEGRGSRDSCAADHADRVETVSLGLGMKNAQALREVINLCDANKATPDGKEYINKGLRDAVLAVMPVQHHLKPDADGARLSGFAPARNGGLGSCGSARQDATGSTPTLWWVEEG